MNNKVITTQEKESEIHDRVNKSIGTWQDDHIALAVLLIVLGWILIGFFHFGDYGVSFDEPYVMENVSYTWRYVEETIHQLISGEQVKDTLGYLDYHDNVYGTAVFQPIRALIDSMKDSRDKYLAMHLYIHIWFLASVVFLYNLCRNLQFSRRVAMLACMMLVFMPRIYTESIYNMKDILFLSLCIISVATGYAMCRSFSWYKLLICAFFSALCVNMRFIGAVIVALLIVLFMVYAEKKEKMQRLIFFVVLCFLFYYLMTPYIWTSPIKRIIDIVGSFSDFTAWDHTVWFMENNVRADDLPWFYLVFWMVMSIPLWVQLLFIVGVSVTGLNFLLHFRETKERITLKNAFLGGIFIVLAGIVVADAFIRPVKYDGWRHFYFLYIFIILWAARGTEIILEEIQISRIKLVFAGLSSLLLLGDLGWCIAMHPFEYLYMNPASRPFSSYFDGDFWMLSAKQGWEKILREEKGNVCIWSYGYTGYYMLSPEEQKRISFAKTIDSSDYAVVHDRIWHWIDKKPEDIAGYTVWQEKYAGGEYLYCILKKDDD